jgi:hypothetical protein
MAQQKIRLWLVLSGGALLPVRAMVWAMVSISRAAILESVSKS